jgi:hypothetical protein
MFVSMQQVQIGFTNYVEQEIARQASGKEKFLYYLALPRVGKLAEGFINGFKDNPMAKDLFDENGNMDLNKLYSEATDAIRKSGKFAMLGIWVSEDTLKTIYGYISR